MKDKVRHPRFNGRADRIRAIFAKPGATPLRIDEIARIVEPKGFSKSISGSVYALVRAGKLEKFSQGGAMHYRAPANPTTSTRKTRPAPPQVEGRQAAVRSEPAKPKATSSKPASKAKIVERSVEPAPPAARKKPQMQVLVAHCSLTGIPEEKRITREQIAADVEAFQASGGKVELIGPTQFFRDPLIDNNLNAKRQPAQRNRAPSSDQDDDE